MKTKNALPRHPTGATPSSPKGNERVNNSPSVMKGWRGTSRGSIAGFTLVELIVVITILVILGTIAFVSLSGFSGSARDSSRVSDLSLISKGLSVTLARNGTYPDPTAWTGITYSGGTVWKQGTMGDSVISQISGFWVRMSKRPIDPLSSAEYVYSITTESKEYSLKADYEGSKVGYGKIPPAPFTKGEFAFSPLVKGVTNGESQGISDIVPETFADTGNPTIAYIAGNYNGIATKVTVGSPKTVYLIAIPNIVTPTSVTGITIGSSQNFILNGSSNASGVTFSPKVIYQSGALPSNDTEKVLFASGVISAYSGTSLSSTPNVSQFITNASSTGTLATVWGGVVNMVWGGSNPTSSTSISPVNGQCGTASGQILIDNSTIVGAGACQQWTLSGSVQWTGPWTWICAGNNGGTAVSCGANILSADNNWVLSYTGCTWANQTYTAPTSYSSCDRADIVICTSNGSGQIWSMCDVGDSTSSDYATNDAAHVGSIFQYGNNADLKSAPMVSASVGCSGLPQNSQYSSGTTFYNWGVNWGGAASWCSTISDTYNLWWGTTGTKIARQWPCASWYHVPTIAEWRMYNTSGMTYATFFWALRLSKVYRYPSTWAYTYGASLIYWTSDPTWFYYWFGAFRDVDDFTSGYWADGWLPVRCIRN